MTAPLAAGTPPPDPKAGRFDQVVRGLQVAMVVVALAAVLGDVLHGSAGQAAEWVLLGTLVLVPVARVLWFVVRWFRRGDPKFAWVGIGVLVVMVAGVVLSR